MPPHLYYQYAQITVTSTNNAYISNNYDDILWNSINSPGYSQSSIILSPSSMHSAKHYMGDLSVVLKSTLHLVKYCEEDDKCVIAPASVKEFTIEEPLVDLQPREVFSRFPPSYVNFAIKIEKTVNYDQTHFKLKWKSISLLVVVVSFFGTLIMSISGIKIYLIASVTYPQKITNALVSCAASLGLLWQLVYVWNLFKTWISPIHHCYSNYVRPFSINLATGIYSSVSNLRRRSQYQRIN